MSSRLTDVHWRGPSRLEPHGSVLWDQQVDHLPLGETYTVPSPEETFAPIEQPAPLPDPTNPDYYKSSAMESIEVIEAFGLGFHLGNAVKYILRSGKKGPALLDLQKARWYIDREIALLERG